MTTSQGDKPEVMLKAVIDKARKNGFDSEIVDFSMRVYGIEHLCTSHNGYTPFYCELLFNHDFAKAYFGEDPMNEDSFAWKEALKEAVLSENPLLYYFENL